MCNGHWKIFGRRAHYLLLMSLLAIASGARRAHPMGNFAISRYSALQIHPDNIHLTYRIDFAEIPTFQELQSLDANGDKTISPEEKSSYLARNIPGWIGNLRMVIDGHACRLK